MDEAAASARPESGRVKIAAIAATMLAPLLATVAVGLRHEIAVPFVDDYRTVVEFANHYSRLPGARSRLLYVFAAQFNEYKMVFQHALIAAMLSLTHRLDFRFLHRVGDALLPLTGLLLLWASFAEERVVLRRLLWTLPVSLLFFSPTYCELLNYATTDLQMLPAMLFALLSIHWLVRRRTSAHPAMVLVLACGAGILCLFASPTGVFLLPIGIVLLQSGKSAAAAMLGWTASLLAAALPYLIGYERMREAPLYGLGFRVLYSVDLVGSALPHAWHCTLLGALILGVFAFGVWRRFDRVNPRIAWFGCWVLACAVLAGMQRGAVSDLYTAVSSRYRYLSILMIICCYIFMVSELRRRAASARTQRWLYGAAVLVSAVFCVHSTLIGDRLLGERRALLVAGLRQYNADPEQNAPLTTDLETPNRDMYPVEVQAKQSLGEALASGLYVEPPEVNEP